MSNTWKRFLSLLLALTMILSLGMTGFAEDAADEGEETADEAELPLEEPSGEPEADETGLEMVAIDPARLHISKLGEEEDYELEDEIDLMDEVDLNEVVRVSIFLDAPATLDAGYSADGVGTNGAAISYRNGLQAQHEAMKTAIAGVIGHELDVKWDLTLTVNAISANVTRGEMVKIAAIPGVRSVQEETLYLPMEDETADPDTAHTSENMVGAVEAWDTLGYTGAGSRIAIIDTGLDTDHQSFAADPFLYSVGLAGATGELLTQGEVQALASQLNSKSSNYVSAKIPYGYNYIDENTTINHMNDPQGEHGSHVAGIAAATRYLGSNGSYSDAASNVGAVGMAPDAQLLIMKVFGSKGGAYDSDYMVAIEDAIVLGCDVANLSLGSAVQGWTYDDTYQDLILGWANGGVGKMVLSISAGNNYDLAKLTASGNLYREDVSWHTGGSPGTYLNSLCVAAAQNTYTKGYALNYGEDLNAIFYESTEDSDGNEYTNSPISSIAGTEYDFVYIDAVGESADYAAVNSAVSLSGKIVIVNRGSINFSAKGNNAISYNPAALVVANNADGVILMNLSDFTGTFPWSPSP